MKVCLFIALFGGMVASIACVREASAAVLYYDDFSGSSSTDLHGTTPDVTIDSNTWNAGALWKADGSINKGGFQTQMAFLPFTPTSGLIYTLSLDANPDDTSLNSSDWFSLHFSASEGSHNGWYNSGTGPGPGVLLRGNHNAADAFYSVSGPGHGSGLETNSISVNAGFVNLKIVLDTTNANWKVDWYVDNNHVRTVTYGADPAINFVGFTAYDTSFGFIDNFTLSDNSVVPEPGVSLLLGACAFGASFVRRGRSAAR